MTIVKICGLTNLEDTVMAMNAGADLLGFVSAERSPRHLAPSEIAKIIREAGSSVPTVLVTHSQSVPDIIKRFEESCADILQLHAPLSPVEYRAIRASAEKVIANVSVEAGLRKVTKDLKVHVSGISELADYILLDTKFRGEIGGTGKTYDWAIAAELMKYSAKPIIIAGGLSPSNVADAIRQVKPFGVDVSSGVESAIGKKDTRKVREFVKNAKSVKV